MVEDHTSRRRRRLSSIAQAYRDSHEVMSAALAIALFSGSGYWLDGKFGWKPVLTICGLVVGCVLAVASLRQMLIRLDAQSKDQRQRDLSSSKETSEE